jgi:hypothetical protein
MYRLQCRGDDCGAGRGEKLLAEWQDDVVVLLLQPVRWINPNPRGSKTPTRDS